MLFNLLLACQPSETTPTTVVPIVEEQKTKLVVYSGRGESLVDELLQLAASDLNIKIEVQYGKTSDLVTRLLTEGEQSPADVIFAQDSGHLGALANQNQLLALSSELLGLVPSVFRDENGKWIGTSGRLRTLVFDSRHLSEETLPKSLKELAEPKWKGLLGWAPSNSSFQAHVSALRNIWGEEETKAWLQGVKANEPTVYPKNSPQVKAVDSEQLRIGWVNHYYLHKLDNPETTAKNFSFQSKDAGNVLMLAGAGVLAHSTDTDDAERLIAWLVSDTAQNWFAQNTYEYPTKTGIPTHPNVPELKVDQLADVKQDFLSDIGPTRQMLKELGLL